MPDAEKRAIVSPTGMEAFGRRPPRFDILSKPVPIVAEPAGTEDAGAAEPPPAQEIAGLLAALNAHVGDFRAGLELFNHAEARPDFARNWAPVACRDAGGALMDFRDALKRLIDALALRGSPRRVRAALKPVEQRFGAAFPLARARRDGTAPGAHSSAPQAPRAHDDMNDAIIVAHVACAGRRITHARDGRAIRFELSEHSLWTLVGLRNDAFAAFEQAG